MIEIVSEDSPSLLLERPWVFVSGIRLGGSYREILAAADIDGVGVIARWEWEGDHWRVWVACTEDGQEVRVFGEGQEVPALPPTAAPLPQPPLPFLALPDLTLFDEECMRRDVLNLDCDDIEPAYDEGCDGDGDDDLECRVCSNATEFACPCDTRPAPPDLDSPF